jgi:hypothetical protein
MGTVTGIPLMHQLRKKEKQRIPRLLLELVLFCLSDPNLQFFNTTVRAQTQGSQVMTDLYLHKQLPWPDLA